MDNLRIVNGITIRLNDNGSIEMTIFPDQVAESLKDIGPVKTIAVKREAPTRIGGYTHFKPMAVGKAKHSNEPYGERLELRRK